MKYSFVLVAGAAMAAAQSLTDLPSCGQTCINNMLALAPSLGCPGAEASCLCNNANFGYGIRDCSNEACRGTSGAAQSAISYGVQYCASALGGSAASSGAIPALTGTAANPSGSGVSGGSDSTVAITTEPITQTVIQSDTTYTTTASTTIYSGPNGIVGGAGNGASGSGSTVPITTEPITETITQSDTTFVTTASTTIYSGPNGIVGGAGVGGNGGSTMTAAPSSGDNDNNSSSTGGNGNGASTSSRASSGAGAAGASSSSSSSTGGVGAMITAAPGLVGMAALAALAL